MILKKKPKTLRKTLGDSDWKYFQPKSEKLKLPKDEDTLFNELDAIADEIFEIVKFVSKYGGQHPTKNCLPNNYARRLVYQLVVHCKKTRPSNVIFKKRMSERAAVKGHPIAGKSKLAASENIFFLCYRAIFTDFASEQSTERSRAAKLLKQAYDDNVPHKYLVGYILQNSSSQDVSQLLTAKS
jgi:hypothetical protein